MINKLIEKCKEVDLLKSEVMAEHNAFSVHVNKGEITLQYWHTDFFEKFPKYSVKYNPNGLFSYHLFVELDGITHLTVLNEEEYRKYVVKEVV